MNDIERERLRENYRQQALDEITKLTGVTAPYGEPWNTLAELQASSALINDERIERLVKMWSPVQPDRSDIEAMIAAKQDHVPPMTDEEASTIRNAIRFVQLYRSSAYCRDSQSADSVALKLAALLTKHGHKTS